MKVVVAAALLVAALLLPAGSPQQQELEPGYWQPSILPQIGLATYYAPGLMQYVEDYRVGHGQLPPCPECVGSVALLRAGDIGRKVWLQPPSGELAGPFQVVDCARVEDIPPLLDSNWVVDVDYAVGQTWGMAGPLDNVIVWPDPAEGNRPPRAALPTQLYIDPREVVITAPTLSPPTPAPGALPTRLPVPRSGAMPPPTAAPLQPAPLTPVITTPTPPGWVVPSPTPPSPAIGDAVVRAGGQILALARTPEATRAERTPGIPVFAAATAGPDIAPGRAGGGPGVAGGRDSPAPPGESPARVSPTGGALATRPVVAPAAPQPSETQPLWQRFWHALMKLVGADGG